MEAWFRGPPPARFSFCFFRAEECLVYWSDVCAMHMLGPCVILDLALHPWNVAVARNLKSQPLASWVVSYVISYVTGIPLFKGAQR